MQQKFQGYQRRLIRLKRRHTKTVKQASQHPFAVPVFVGLGLIIIGLGIYFFVVRGHSSNLPGPKVVIISHDNVQQIVPSIEPTVGMLLNKLHIAINTGDVVEPSLSTTINQDDFRINIYRAVPVEIVDGSSYNFTFSAAATPRAIAAQAGSALYPDDIVSTIPTANFLTQGAIGEQIVINRAMPVNLNLYGTQLAIRTHAKTVADLISEKKIHLATSDQVIPALNTPITTNAQVFIIRQGQKIESVTETIAMPTNTIYDNNLAYGTSAVEQQGAPGQEVITYQDQLQNGVVVSRVPIQTVITVPAVTEIVAVGINLSGIKGDMALAGISPGDYAYADYIISHESGWCPTKAQGEHNCPASPIDPLTPDGYGLCQATPGYKMQSAGADWQTNPITQLRWCAGYANGHYGSWYNAYEHWLAYAWW